jgi:6-pyruvoyltetrahydropterin/6-carboxytetrahydropterin synthase
MPTKRTARSRRPATAAAAVPALVRPQRGVVTITRQVHFNSAHRLYNPTKSLAWNQKQYGLCTNPHWHGHNYVLEVSLRGEPDPVTGYIIDLGALKRILHAAVVDKCDHRNLNDEVDFLRGIIPSTENLVIAFWNEIEPHVRHLPHAKLHCVRLYETPRNFAEYFGPNAR